MLSQSRGVYVTVGRHGFRYLQPRQADSVVATQDRMRVGDTMVVQSAQLHRLSDLSQEDFIKSLNEWTNRGSIQVFALLFVLAPLSLLLYLGVRPEILLAAFGVSAAIILVARYIENRRRRFILAYDLPGSYALRYEQFCRTLLDLGASGSFRGTRSLHRHGDWKRNAGATTTVLTERARLLRACLCYIVTNVEPVTLTTQGKEICFLPDRMLIRYNGRFAAISYHSLNVDTRTGVFSWDAPVPADAVVIGHSWLYRRKDGGPDRRFNGNRQIPDVRVGYLSLETDTGLTLLLQATNLTAVQRSHDEIVNYSQPFRLTGETEENVERVDLRQALWILGLASQQQVEAIEAAYRGITERLRPERLALMPPDLANFLSDRVQEADAAYALLTTDSMLRNTPILSVNQEATDGAAKAPASSGTLLRREKVQKTAGLIPHAIAMCALMTGLVGFTWSEWRQAQFTARPAQEPAPTLPQATVPLIEQPRHEEPRRRTVRSAHRKSAPKKESPVAKSAPSLATGFVDVDFEHPSPPQPKGTTEPVPEPKRSTDENSETTEVGRQ